MDGGTLTNGLLTARVHLRSPCQALRQITQIKSEKCADSITRECVLMILVIATINTSVISLRNKGEQLHIWSIGVSRSLNLRTNSQQLARVVAGHLLTRHMGTIVMKNYIKGGGIMAVN